MKNKFAPTTIWAVQAVIAMLLAFGIGHYFHLEKPWWSVLTAIILISQTWGESLKKAFERIVMTIIGGTIGTLLYFSMSHNPHALFFVLMTVTFFMIYNMGYSFQATAFFVTIFVVFLFAIIGSWNYHILEIRIYETMIGAACAVVTSVFILPTHGNSNLQQLFDAYIVEACSILDLSFEIAFANADRTSITQVRDRLYRHFRRVTEAYKTSSYEMLFLFAPRHKIRLIINEFSLLMHYITSILESSAYLEPEQFSTDERDRLFGIKQALCQDLKSIMGLIGNSKPYFFTSQDSALGIITANLIKKMQKTSENTDCILNNLSFVYYLQKTDEILSDLERQIKKM